jgi:predicted tellurium resistance membrane protein TerC
MKSKKLKFSDYLLLIFIVFAIYIAESFWVGILWALSLYIVFSVLIEIMVTSSKANKKSNMKRKEKKKKITTKNDTINISLDD